MGKKFSEIMMNTLQHLENNGTVTDVDLMMKLDFTPPTWKVWKPKLIEKLTSITHPKSNSIQGDNTKIKITYEKKNTLWKAIEFLE